MRPKTVFDTPQAPLTPDTAGERNYGNISNRMEVTERGRTYYVLVAVPTCLFTFMAQVAGIKPSQEVTLSLEKLGDYFVFSLMTDTSLYDLWSYPGDSIPGWLTNRNYRC